MGRRNRKEAGNKYGEWTFPCDFSPKLKSRHRFLDKTLPVPTHCYNISYRLLSVFPTFAFMYTSHISQTACNILRQSYVIQV